MAMEWPNPRVISHEFNNSIAHARRIRIPKIHELRIPPLWVLRSRDHSIPLSHPFRDDPEVVAVKVHWVCEGGQAAQDEADGRVLTKVVYVPLRVVGVGGIA
jgi:hypothetical protein